MPVSRVKAPEYPRPVSPVCVDEIPICDDTIVYHDRNDGVENDDKANAAKRRRIESCATSYLRGEPLFISTASLKGPFGKGWQNPWAKSRKSVKRGQTSKDNVSQDAIASTGKQVSARLVRQKMSPPRTETNTRVLEDTPITKVPPVINKTSVVIPVTEAEENRRRDSGVEEQSSKNRDVEDWLRRNSSHEGSEIQPHGPLSSPSSPTNRLSRLKTEDRESHPIDGKSPPGAGAGVDAVVEKTSSHGLGRPRTCERCKKAGMMDSSKDGSRETTLCSVCRHRPDSQASAQSAGIPALLSLTNPSPRHRKSRHKSQDTTGSQHRSASVHTAPEQPTTSLPERATPSLSKGTTTAGVIHELPPAQVPLQPPLLALGLSSLASSDHLPQEPADQPSIEALHLSIGAPPQVAQEPSTFDSERGLDPSSTRSSKESPLGLREAPRTLAPMVGVKSARGLAHADNDRNSVPTLAKTRREHGARKKNKNRASFAPDEHSSGSLQESIKVSMKVAKSTLLDQDTSAPKGILKSSFAPGGALVSSTNAASSSTKQDAQQPLQLDVGEDEGGLFGNANFDLDAAIDDLGSYLGTWDAEREAALLESVSG